MLRQWILVLSLILALAAPLPVFADDDEDDNNLEPVITDTHVTPDKTVIDIQGERVHLGVFPNVILGANGEDNTPIDYPLTVTAIDPGGTQITANLPTYNGIPELEDGAYRLTVETANGDDEFVAVIGAIGAQGIQGDRGPQGEKGMQGEPGLRGFSGANGETGPAGTSCSFVTGTTTIQCGADAPVDVKGDPGADGTTAAIESIAAAMYTNNKDGFPPIPPLNGVRFFGINVFCNDSNDVVLHGGCKTVDKDLIFTETGARAGNASWRCKWYTGKIANASFVSASVTCLAVPGP